LSYGSNKKGKMVDWRRNKVQQLLVRGYSQWDVAEELQIDQSTVSRDIQYLRQQAQENLQSLLMGYFWQPSMAETFSITG
jgi:DNA-binding NarL/FixJ family response regulator